jgi:hypothetical protein
LAGIHLLKMVARPSNTGIVELLLETAVGWIDRPAFASDRGRIGRVSAVLVDAERRPQWLVVRSGRFRKCEERVAVSQCEFDGGTVWVDADRAPAPQARQLIARRRGDCA